MTAQRFAVGPARTTASSSCALAQPRRFGVEDDRLQGIESLVDRAGPESCERDAFAGRMAEPACRRHQRLETLFDFRERRGIHEDQSGTKSREIAPLRRNGGIRCERFKGGNGIGTGRVICRGAASSLASLKRASMG